MARLYKADVEDKCWYCGKIIEIREPIVNVGEEEEPWHERCASEVGVPIDAEDFCAQCDEHIDDCECEEEPEWNEDLDILRKIEAGMVNPYPYEGEDLYDDIDNPEEEED